MEEKSIEEKSIIETKATMPEYLLNLDRRTSFESLQKIVNVKRDEIMDMPIEQRDVIALDILRDGLIVLTEKGALEEKFKPRLMGLGMKWGVLSAIYTDFADRSTRIVKPQLITKNEELAIDLMQGMKKLHPEIQIMSDVVAGSFKKESFGGTKKA